MEVAALSDGLCSCGALGRMAADVQTRWWLDVCLDYFDTGQPFSVCRTRALVQWRWAQSLCHAFPSGARISSTHLSFILTLQTKHLLQDGVVAEPDDQHFCCMARDLYRQACQMYGRTTTQRSMPTYYVFLLLTLHSLHSAFELDEEPLQRQAVYAQFLACSQRAW